MGTDYNSIGGNHFCYFKCMSKGLRVLSLSTKKGYANDTSQWNLTGFFFFKSEHSFVYSILVAGSE